MRILVFHGYLLRGTGSNVYNARLAAALARGGATVDLLCQERRARELDFVDAVGTWVDGEPRGGVMRGPGRLRVGRGSGSVGSRVGPPRGGGASGRCCRPASPTATRASRPTRSSNAPPRRS